MSRLTPSWGLLLLLLRKRRTGRSRRPRERERSGSWVGLLHRRRGGGSERGGEGGCAESILPGPPSLLLGGLGGGRGGREGGVSSRGEGVGVVEDVCCGGGVGFPIHGRGGGAGEESARAYRQNLVWILGGEGVEGEGAFRMGLFPPLPFLTCELLSVSTSSFPPFCFYYNIFSFFSFCLVLNMLHLLSFWLQNPPLQKFYHIIRR